MTDLRESRKEDAVMDDAGAAGVDDVRREGPAPAALNTAYESHGAKGEPRAYSVHQLSHTGECTIWDADGRVLAIVPRRYELDRRPAVEETLSRAKGFAALPELLDVLDRMQAFSFDAVTRREGYHVALDQWCEIKRAARRALSLAGAPLSEIGTREKATD